MPNPHFLSEFAGGREGDPGVADMHRETCPFCSPSVISIAVREHGSVFAIKDQTPVTSGHLLIIPKRHVPDYFSLNRREKQDADALVALLAEQSAKADPEITGFNIGVNVGTSSGQTIFHCHIHLIPRRTGDVENPCGGVRGVIPEKMNYLG